EQALADLRWLGLNWDAGPVVQTERLSLYESALDGLKAQELVYPCTCTRSDVEQAASAPHADGTEVMYPGTCSHRSVADATALAGRPFAWRFRVGDVPAYDDLFLCPVLLPRDYLCSDFFG